MTRIIMHGCNGKMGQMIASLIAQDEEIEIVAGVDVSDHIRNPFPVFKTIVECNVYADAVIDFASAKATDALLDHCLEKKITMCFMYNRPKCFTDKTY